jgi:uncharacterized protein (DUF302 family)
MTRKIEIERFTLTSSKPFDGIIANLKAAVGQPDIAEFWRSTHRAQSVTELESTIEKAVGRTGLMLFAEFDHGAIVRKGTGRDAPKIVRLVVGNPLTMRRMVQHVPDAGTYAPVTILLDERSDGVHLSYDRMASFLAAYESADALKVAKELDAKIEALLASVA